MDSSNASRLVSSVDEDEAARHNMATLKGDQEVWFLSENGVYEVLMQMKLLAILWRPALEQEKLNEIVNKYDFSEVI